MRKLLAILCLFSLSAWSPASFAKAPGKIKIVGKVKKAQVQEGAKKRAYVVLDPMGSMKLQATGPAKALLLVRGTAKGSATLKLDMDGTLASEVKLKVNPKASRGVHLEVPEGEHLITVLAVDKVMVRPLKVNRKAKPHEVAAVFAPVAEKAPPAKEEVADEPEPVKPVKKAPAPKLKAKDTSKSVLVLELTAIGGQETAARQVATRVAEILAGAGLTVTTYADIKDQLSLEADKQLMGCREDAACMAEVGAAMKSDLVVVGSVGTIGSSLVLNLSLVDPKAARAVGRASTTLEGTDQLSDVLPGALATLFGWELAQTAPKYKLPEGKKVSFAVFDLTPSGVSKEVAANLTQILSVEIKRVEGASVISRDDMAAMLRLEADKSMLGCSDDTSCIAEIGGALGVDKLVVGHVGKLSESFVVSLRLIDPRQAKVDSRITESFRGDEDQLIRAVRHAGRKLLGVGTQAVGKLAVSASEEEAEVFLDSTKRGALPLPPLDELAAGRHTLRVSKNGYFDFQSDVYVDPHETTAVWARLDERPARWYQKWWVWTIVGAVVVGAGVTTAVLLTQSEPGAGTGTVTFDLQAW